MSEPTEAGGPPAGMIDAHLHLTTERMIRRMMERPQTMREEALRRSRVRGMTLEERLKPVAGGTLEQHAANWLSAFDQAGGGGGGFVAGGAGHDEVAEFIAQNPRRGHGVGSLAAPRPPDAARTVRTF